MGGKFSLNKMFFLPHIFSAVLVTTDVSDTSQPTRVLDHQPPPVVTQSYGSVTTEIIDRQQGYSSRQRGCDGPWANALPFHAD